MVARCLLFTAAVLGLGPGLALGQDCLPTYRDSAEYQMARRDAIRVARTINTLQANQPGRTSGRYLSQAELSILLSQWAPAAGDEFLGRLNLEPGAQVIEGWRLRLDVTPRGYWFAIRKDNDPCGLAIISNEEGVILTAAPIR